MHQSPVGFSVLTLLLSLWGATADAQIRSDEEVLFFPTAARLNESGDKWLIPIHGWVFEAEQNSLTRRAVVSRLADDLELDDDADARRLLKARCRWLLADNERGKRIEIAVGDVRHTLPPSAEDGHFEDVLELPVAVVAELVDDARISFRALLPEGDEREFVGAATLVSSVGLTVISDIDDTVKISEVTQKQRLLRRTLVEPYEVVDGMAAQFQTWQNADALIWYVSAGPWQLYSPLQSFLVDAGFPSGLWQMKRLRLADASVLRLFADPYEYKLSEITAIIEAFPGRHYVLIGDSGERDPEAYGEIARRFPDQIVRIAIRDVTDESAAAERYQAAFHDVPAGRWHVFLDGAELKSLIPE